MITPERLKEFLSYDEVTGIFVWLVSRSRTRAGVVAGCFNSTGYRQITIDGNKYCAHRLAWLYVYGAFPQNEIDHINGMREDNRLANLREARFYQNQQNKRRAYNNNKSGLLGVSPARGKWRAQIFSGGKKIHIGDFQTPEAAHAAYLSAKREHHEFCTI